MRSSHTSIPALLFFQAALEDRLNFTRICAHPILVFLLYCSSKQLLKIDSISLKKLLALSLRN